MHLSFVNNQRSSWKKILNFSGKYIYRNDSDDSAYNCVCSDCLDESIINFIKILTLQIGASCIAMIGPTYGLFNGLKVTMISVRLPYFNRNPELEYIILLCWDAFNAIPCLFYVVVIDTVFNIVNGTIRVSSELCALHLNDLSNDMVNGVGGRKQWHEMLKTILMQTKYIDEYDFL